MKTEAKAGLTEDRIAGIKNGTVLVVGDIMLDRFIYGEVGRISPEGPIPVLKITREDKMLGGAGNVVSNLAGLETGCRLCTVIGDDDNGVAVRMLLKDRGVALSGVVVDHERPTTVKSRFLAQNQQLLRTDSETADPVGETAEAELIKAVEDSVAGAGAIVLSDYGKGVLTPKVISGIIAAAAKAGVPVLVDPKGSDYSIYKGADIVTPNRKELGEATGGMATKTDEEVEAAASHLMAQAGIKAVVATRSQDGLSVLEKGNDAVHMKTQALEVFDVSGAGDTVIATIAAALAAGLDLVEAAALANVAGGIVVAKIGTAPIRYGELAAKLADQDLVIDGTAVKDRMFEALYCGWDEAREYVQRWKARGLSVGFTNGCFDILHYGHVTYLNAARGRCDRLVLGLNCDASVKRLKGEERPVNNEDARAAVLGALASVDMVVLFGESESEGDTPCDLVELLQPDVYFKGGDYKIEDLPEAPIVKAYGGRVEIMNLEEGHSTTDTIKKLKGKAA